MPGEIAHDAETRKIDASKAVSARKFNDSQTKWKELLVRPAERGRPTENKGNWPLLEDDEDNCRRNSAGHLEARKRGRRAKCLEGVDIRIVVELTYLPVYKGKWKSSTAMTEENRIQVHLVGTIGEERMRFITREQLQELLECKAKNCGRSMVDHMRFRLRSIFELAMSERVVEFNPATSLYTPRKCQPGRPRRVLSPAQAGALVELLGPREGVIARLATWEGMRPGEILALRVSDLDGDSLWVKRRLYKGELADPKNERSARQVALTLGTKMLLEVWVQALSTGSDSDWLFPSESGTPIRRENLWPRYILPKLEPADLEWATFQVMRRSFATWAKKAGVDAHTRSAQMGNTVDVNENEYAVATFEQKLAAIRRLEKAVKE